MGEISEQGIRRLTAERIAEEILAIVDRHQGVIDDTVRAAVDAKMLKIPVMIEVELDRTVARAVQMAVSHAVGKATNKLIRERAADIEESARRHLDAFVRSQVES